MSLRIWRTDDKSGSQANLAIEGIISKDNLPKNLKNGYKYKFASIQSASENNKPYPTAKIGDQYINLILDESDSESSRGIGIREGDWNNIPIVSHEDYKDLGNYVIEINEYTEDIEDEGIAIVNSKYDNHPVGCTACVKRNEYGEVLFGRNMDIEVSQCPGFIYKTSFGKYKTLGISYSGYSPYTYAQLKQGQSSWTAEEKAAFRTYIKSLPYLASDSINEHGLYVEMNMRTAYEFMNNKGTRKRAAGTKRLCSMSLPTIITQNCKNIPELLEWITSEDFKYDIYTMVSVDNPHVSGWNYGALMGDALGNFGVLEIAQDEINYIPFVNGQANYYLTPKWTAQDLCGSGYGRLQLVQQEMQKANTIPEMMNNVMKKAMWRNESLWVGTSYKDATTGKTVFVDDQGNPQLDWRSDYVQSYPVNEEGKLVILQAEYDAAVAATYDTNIKSYYDAAINTAHNMIIATNSTKYKGTNYLELYAGYNKYELALQGYYYTEQGELVHTDDPAILNPIKQANKGYFDLYMNMVDNQNSNWCLDDSKFEALKAVVYAKLHLKDEQGVSQIEKLIDFDTHIEEKEQALRNAGDIWTTSLSIGANCTEKKLRIKFWENEKVIYSFNW